jgi:Virulence-associated protein E/Bifunctional DNA primase/polymerase, N-terminal/Primase C terminal 2 (PriCT-2)
MSETLTDSLVYYAAHGAALFPIPSGQKAPFGIVKSFKHDFSRSPATWKKWQDENPGCNFGVVGFASNWIIADIDTSGSEAGRAEAWALWGDLCRSWGLPGPFAPHVQSARGGWHVYFQVPPHIDASTLRQPDAIKKRINIRCVGFTVAAGSYYDGTARGEQSGPYLLMSAAAPHAAPAALVEHCTRAPLRPTSTNALPGSRDKGDVAALLLWLNEKDAFEDYESWFQIGMALRLEYGDDGFDLWELTHDGTVTPDAAAAKWNSFATDPNPQSVTLNSFLDRAHKLGWRGTVRKSTASMFDGVAQLAAASGASLYSGMPVPPSSPAGAMPMLAGQEELARLASPILAEFLDATPDARPAAEEWPTLPGAMAGHGLYVAMVAAISRTVALAEAPKFKSSRVTDVLAVLSLLHADVFDALCRRLRAMGHTLQDRRIRLSSANLSEKVERITVGDAWIYDKNGEPQSDNSDNVAVLLGVLGLDLRWNAWLERMEIQGGVDVDLRWTKWTYVDDTVVAKLRTRANRTKTRFRPGKDFLWESLLSLAHSNLVDPVLEHLAKLAAEWDGVPRLSSFLHTYCNTPDDAYHQAVGRSLVGGMVTRIRRPGVKFDTMPIFFGRQGTGKSTMLAILALAPEYFSDSILLGDASKELVLSLAGKTLVEISEMGMRGNTNVNHVKAMISRTTDAGRTAYARAVTERARRNIWAGSTNDESPLEDPSGNRRFLPVRVDSDIDLEGLRRDVGQIMGEAAALEAAGTDFALPRSVWQDASEHQEAARSVSDVEARLVGWFAPTAYTQDAFVSTDDLAELSDLAGWRGVHAFRNSVLKRLGFREVQPYLAGVRTRGWLRGEGRPGEVVRYAVSRSVDGRPRVRAEMPVASRVGKSCPPLPY